MTAILGRGDRAHDAGGDSCQVTVRQATVRQATARQAAARHVARHATARHIARHDRVQRTLDVGLSAVALVVSAPIQAVVAVIVLAAHGRPVFFRQPRPGRDGVVFELVKFRTMRPPDDQRVDDADRLTAVGRLLRSTSLDELPTLWNVLRGHMSLVGPRPLLVAYLDRYTPEQARRHEVRPGITGLAQVSGRNALSWEARLALDVEYVERRSLRLDMAILARTVLAVARRQGISGEGEVTMSEFRGSGERQVDRVAG